MQEYGPRTKVADELHAAKYREKGESFRECAQRVAFGLQDDDAHYRELRPILLDMRFLPAGRIQAAVGASFQATPYNCFVSGPIADSFVHGQGCIMDRLKEAATTLRLGGGIGYDWSTLRPSGDAIMKLGTQSCGPVEFMDLFDVIGSKTRAVGHRHGAQMGVLRVDHPDIEAFIRVKQNETALRRFNLSIAVTDDFMMALHSNKPFQLKFNGRIYREIDAAALWEKIMRSTYEWSEPGVIFIDRVNTMNNLYYCEQIHATNPCGEQPLPPFGACLLGSFNLSKYLSKYLTMQGGLRVVGGAAAGTAFMGGGAAVGITGNTGGAGSAASAEDRAVWWSFDFDQLEADVDPIVRAMDNVIDRAIYPLSEQRAEAITKRRMGLGVTGLANAAEACGCPYGTPAFIEFENRVLETIKLAAYRASIANAKKKGPFPLYDDRYLKSNFIRTLPEDVFKGIELHGIRNSHLTSIAPTGTISLTADNVSSSIEPVFQHEIKRMVEMSHGHEEQTLTDYGVAFLDTRGRLASEVSAKEHVAVLATAQRHVDSAVSKTVNVDGRQMNWEEFKDVYQTAWDSGAKSCTTFNVSGNRMALLKPAEEEEAAACEIMADGTRSCE